MDSVIPTEEVQNPTTTTETTMTLSTVEVTAPPETPRTEPKQDPALCHPQVETGEVRGSSTPTVEPNLPLSTTSEIIPKPTLTDSTRPSEGTEPQGTKRPQEMVSPTHNESFPDETPKPKKLRKDGEESVELGEVNLLSTHAPVVDKEKDNGDEETNLEPKPSNNPIAPKVPPIKIVLQGHGGGNGETETITTVSQPHVSMPSLGFPYIVTIGTTDSAGIPSGGLAGKDKSRGTDDQTFPKVKEESLPVSEGGKEKTGAGRSESPQPVTQSTPLQLTPTEGPSIDQIKATSESSSNVNSGPSTTPISAVPSATPTVTFGEDRLIIDGTQSPSLLGKEKPTRVTRSSQRIATTVHSSPGTSPKTSTCSSPNQMEVEVPANPAPLLSQEKEEGFILIAKSKEEQDLHPRKRKLKTKEKEKEKEREKELKEKEKEREKELREKELKEKEKEKEQSSALSNVSSSSSTSGEPGEASGQVAPPTSAEPTHPVLNCYEMYLNIRKQIQRRRQSLFPVQPKPPQGFKDYLMNRGTYVLSTTPNAHLAVSSNAVPQTLTPPLKDLFLEQEKERHRLRLQQVVEKEKLVLSVEQEILRVHGRAARALSNQALPFSVCTFLKDEEVYNLLTPEQEEKDRNVRSRYNGRLFLSWLQDVDDKWEKIKESMVLRHHNEAESLYAVQKMDWEWKMKEVGLCEPKATPIIDELSVPMVFVSDDFDLLPA